MDRFHHCDSHHCHHVHYFLLQLLYLWLLACDWLFSTHSLTDYFVSSQSTLTSTSTHVPTATEVAELFHAYRKVGAYSDVEVDHALASTTNTTALPLVESASATTTTTSNPKTPLATISPTLSGSAVPVSSPTAAGVIKYPTASEIESQYLAYAKLGLYGQAAQTQAVLTHTPASTESTTATAVRYPTPAETADLVQFYKQMKVIPRSMNDIDSAAGNKAVRGEGGANGAINGRAVNDGTVVDAALSPDDVAIFYFKLLEQQQLQELQRQQHKQEAATLTPAPSELDASTITNAPPTSSTSTVTDTGDADNNSANGSEITTLVAGQFPPSTSASHSSSVAGVHARATLTPSEITALKLKPAQPAIASCDPNCSFAELQREHQILLSLQQNLLNPSLLYRSPGTSKSVPPTASIGASRDAIDTPSQYLSFVPTKSKPYPSNAVLIPARVIDYTSTDVSISVEPSLGLFPPEPSFASLRQRPVEQMAAGSAATSQSLADTEKTQGSAKA